VFDAIINSLLDLVREHGTLVLFLAAVIENAAFLSWIVPGESLLAVGGYLVQQGELRLEVAWSAAFLGVLVGDHIAYFIGRAGGSRLVNRLPVRGLLVRVERLILRYGGLVVVFGRFSGGLRPAVVFTVGSMNLPYRQFWPFELLGAAAWSAFWLGLGALGGAVFESFGEWRPALFFGSLVVGGVLAWLFRGRLRQWLVEGPAPDQTLASPAVGAAAKSSN
jgi:membrane protein DedA with SNARE-associated domain